MSTMPAPSTRNVQGHFPALQWSTLAIFCLFFVALLSLFPQRCPLLIMFLLQDLVWSGLEPGGRGEGGNRANKDEVENEREATGKT
jgi:hypothetical protein